jgi:hypothetical protein
MAALTTRLEQLSQVVAIGSRTAFYNFGDTEPVPEDRLYPWLKTIGGFPDKWYVYVDGSWVAVNPSHIWYSGTALGSANIYTANTALPYPSTVNLTVGDVFLVRVLHINTLSSTLSINGFLPATIQNGGRNLLPGELVSPQTYAFMWDGTYFRLLNATIPDSDPVMVYATSAFTSEGTADIDLSFTLPTGKTRWKKVRMYATAAIDSAAGATPVSLTVVFKWNSGSLLNSAVTTAGGFGAGNSGKQMLWDLPDIQDYTFYAWEGEVPEAIEASAPLVIRASLTLSGGTQPEDWMFWAVAVAT